MSAVGSTTTSDAITVDNEPTEGFPHYLLAVVARLPGEAGTQWRSDVWVLNPFVISQRLWIEYRPEGDSQAYRQQLVLLGGEQLAVEDILAAYFPSAGYYGKGALHAYGTDGVFVNSRTFNQGATGTFGQAIPALAGGDLLSTGETGVLLKLKSTGDARCNVGFTEFDGQSTTVEVRLYAIDNGSVSVLASRGYEVEPYNNLQVNRIFEHMGLAAEYEASLAEVEVLGGGRIYAYASIVDDATGDAEFIPAMKKWPDPSAPRMCSSVSQSYSCTAERLTTFDPTTDRSLRLGPFASGLAGST
jgi:hypothetical protein